MSLAACGLGAAPDQFVNAGIDLLMGHDGTASLVVDRFRKAPFAIVRPENVFLVFDHFAPPATVERANIQNKLLAFAREQQLSHDLYGGICHQLLLEHEKVLPGRLVIGADSHTTTAGALGALATGVGATDFFNALRTGEIWLRVPRTIAVHLRGALGAHLSGKDVILAVMRELGSDGANYKSLEFLDETETGINDDERAAICNMAVDVGAKFGVFRPDAITRAAIAGKTGAVDALEAFAARLRAFGAPAYACELTLDLDRLVPLLQAPDGSVQPVGAFAGTKISQIFIGSCSSGRLSDVSRASDILARGDIRFDGKLIVIPSSRAILLEALRRGYVERLIAAGAVLGNPSCGPCCNIDKGVLGDGEVCVSTSNRNFRGRMGANDASVFIASAATAAASALAGHIADPRDVLA